MPSNILIIENDVNLTQTYIEIFNSNLKIQYKIIDSFNSLKEQLNTNQFSHLIINRNVDKNWNIKYNELINIPILVISDEQEHNNSYFITNLPLTYQKVFAYLCETSGFSFKTLEGYALGEEDVLKELKKQINIEFESSFSELPQLIAEKKLDAIKSKVHQISSKFSLLEMNTAYEFSKIIDTTIYEDSENQLENCKNLLVDIAVVINQMKN